MAGWIALGEDVADVGEEHEQVFRRQALQANNGAGEVDESLAGKGVLHEAGLERLVAIEPAA